MSSPVQIGSLTNWAQVSFGNQVSASVKTDGTLWTWGSGSLGELGLGTTVNKQSPNQVGALTNWAQVSAGDEFMGCVKTDGTLWTWGSGSVGRTGQNNIINLSSPTQVGALTDWAQVSAGNLNCAAVKTDGTLWTWGYNNGGRLGDGTVINRSSPVQVGSLTNWKQVAAGVAAHCACVKTDGTLFTWGANGSGQLGDGTTISRSSPVQVGSLTNWGRVAVGNGVTACTTTTGALFTWGVGNVGRNGQNDATLNLSSPVQVGALTNWLQPAAFDKSLGCVKTDGTLWMSGENSNGKLGDGTVINRSSPVQIGALTDWFSVDVGSEHSAALLGVI
jgi:alpha-tubulin suppressor-like RCC1 family protein